MAKDKGITPSKSHSQAAPVHETVVPVLESKSNPLDELELIDSIFDPYPTDGEDATVR